MASDNNVSVLDLKQYTPEELKHEMMCRELNDIVGEFLCRQYPGYPWAVAADIRNGVVNFWLGVGHGGRAPYGMTARISDSCQGLLLGRRGVKVLAGELLERYGLTRGKMNENEMMELMNGADFAGRIKIDEG